MPAFFQRILLLCTLLSACWSCDYFETEKIPAETFYQQEVEAIDWESVDRYPAFPDCIELAEKQQQKACFENTLLAHLYSDLADRQMELLEETNDTVWIHFSVLASGAVQNTAVDMKAQLREQLPEFDIWIEQSLAELPASEPAFKRGIPVETQFTLPIIVRSEG